MDKRMVELEWWQSLYFDQPRTGGPVRKLLKRAFQKTTRPLLGKQVAFNAGVRDVLSELRQRVEQLQGRADQLQSVVDGHFPRSADQARERAGLFFNEPIHVGYSENGEAYWHGTNERILEKAFVLRALARLYDSTDVSILDVGSAESLLPYELATLGYSVTAIDVRPIALYHPNLKFVKGDICHPVFPPESFDCATALSTVEHIGLGWYGDPSGAGLDVEAVRRIHSLLKPGGHFVLTVPYGRAAVTPLHRVYDKAALEDLVRPFSVVQASYGVRMDSHTFTVTGDEAEAGAKEHDPESHLPGAVALLVCRR